MFPALLPDRHASTQEQARRSPPDQHYDNEEDVKIVHPGRSKAPGVYSIEASLSSDSSLPDLPRKIQKVRKGGVHVTMRKASSPDRAISSGSDDELWVSCTPIMWPS